MSILFTCSGAFKLLQIAGSRIPKLACNNHVTVPTSRKFVKSSDESSDFEKKVPKKFSSDEEATQSQEPNEDNEKWRNGKVWHLGNERIVKVSEYEGMLLIDIRHYYYRNGMLQPTKKGISLSVAQWRKFVDAVPDVDEAVKSQCEINRNT